MGEAVAECEGSRDSTDSEGSGVSADSGVSTDRCSDCPSAECSDGGLFEFELVAEVAAREGGATPVQAAGGAQHRPIDSVVDGNRASDRADGAPRKVEIAASPDRRDGRGARG